jgi:hypothetical protein
MLSAPTPTAAELRDNSICARLAEGKRLRAICSEAGMPGKATVFRWIARH